MPAKFLLAAKVLPDSADHYYTLSLHLFPTIFHILFYIRPRGLAVVQGLRFSTNFWASAAGSSDPLVLVTAKACDFSALRGQLANQLAYSFHDHALVYMYDSDGSVTIPHHILYLYVERTSPLYLWLPLYCIRSLHHFAPL
jgi:hypothetical protein